MTHTPRRNGYTSSRRSSDSMRRNRNSVAYTSSVKLGPVTHTVLIALMITVLGLIYLTQATRATSLDYEAQEINQQIEELASQKTDLEVDNARLTALEQIRDSAVAKSMTTTDDSRFVSQ